LLFSIIYYAPESYFRSKEGEGKNPLIQIQKVGWLKALAKLNSKPTWRQHFFMHPQRLKEFHLAFALGLGLLQVLLLALYGTGLGHLILA
jgi:hypothetical protein